MDLYIDHNSLPEEERKASRVVEENLRALLDLVEDFRSTLDLFNHVNTLEPDPAAPHRRGRWSEIAGRNGALVVYGFWQVMEAINALKAPTLWQRADVQERRTGDSLFTARFPQIAAIRISAAHPGELSATPQERKKHGLNEAVENQMISVAANSGTFIESMMVVAGKKMTYSSSVKGKLVSYELSEESAQALEQIVGQYLVAFMPLEDPKSRAGREWRQKTDEELHRYQIDHPEWFSPPDGH